MVKVKRTLYKDSGLFLCVAGLILVSASLTSFGPVDESLLSRPGLVMSMVGVVVYFSPVTIQIIKKVLMWGLLGLLTVLFIAVVPPSSFVGLSLLFWLLHQIFTLK